MTDPDREAVRRLQVAAATQARKLRAAIFARYRVEVDEEVIGGFMTALVAEVQRVDELKREDVAALQRARTRPNKAAARGAWRDERTPVVDVFADEDTKPSRPRR